MGYGERPEGMAGEVGGAAGESADPSAHVRKGDEDGLEVANIGGVEERRGIRKPGVGVEPAIGNARRKRAG